MTRVLTTFIALLLLFTSCQHAGKQESPEGTLSKLTDKTWYVIAYDADKTNQGGSIEERLAAEAANASRASKGSLLQFFPDKQFVFVEGTQYFAGKWELDESTKAFNCMAANATARKNFIINITQLDTTKMSASVKENGTRGTLTANTDQYHYEAPDHNPWHPDNNKWRIKPTGPESDKAILLRLKNHIQHYITLLQAMVDNKGRSLSIANSPSFIQIYNGGIGLKDTAHIDPAWYDTFYNKTDADKCLAIFEKILTESPYAGQSSGSWPKDDLQILKSIYARILEMEQKGETK